MWYWFNFCLFLQFCLNGLAWRHFAGAKQSENKQKNRKSGKKGLKFGRLYCESDGNFPTNNNISDYFWVYKCVIVICLKYGIFAWKISYSVSIQIFILTSKKEQCGKYPMICVASRHSKKNSAPTVRIACLICSNFSPIFTPAIFRTKM